MRNALKASVLSSIPPTIPNSIKNNVIALWDVNKKADAFYNIPQLCVNGDFHSGITGAWFGGYGTLTLENGMGKVVANGTDVYADVVYQSNLKIIPGHIIYAAFTAMLTANAPQIMFRVSSTANTSTNGIATQMSPVANTWYTLGATYTLPVNYSGKLNIHIRELYSDTATANGKVMYVSQVKLFDLTAVFGQGNEPTQAEFEDMLANGPVETASANFNQLFVNGDFHSGTTNWNAVQATQSVSDGINTLTGSGVGGAQIVLVGGSTPNIVPGHKYYVCVVARTRDSVTQNLQLEIDGITSGTNLNIVTKVSPNQDEWYYLSGVGAAPLDSAGGIKAIFYATYASPAVQAGKTVEIKQVFYFDLTAIFGAGREPSQSEVDMVVKSAGYFEGVQSVAFSRITKYWEGDKPVKCNPNSKYFLADTMGSVAAKTGTLNQLFSGGDFSLDTDADGLADGLTLVGTVATKTLSAGVQTFTSAASNSGIRTAASYAPGGILYACAYVNADSGTSLSMGMASKTDPATSITSGANVWMLLSNRESGATASTVQITDSRTSGWTAVKVKSFMVFDLTALFGAGNEPTQKQMDAIMQDIGVFFSGAMANAVLNPLERNQFGRGHHLKLWNMAYNTASGPQASSGSLLFDGVDDWAGRSEYQLVPPNASFSVFYFVAITGDSIPNQFDYTYLDAFSGSKPVLQVLYSVGTTKLSSYLADCITGTQVSAYVNSLSMVYGKYISFALVYNNSTKKFNIYVNGVLKGTSGTLTTGNAAINYYQWARPGASGVKDILGFESIFNKALSDQEVRQLHNGGCKRFGVSKS